MPDVGRIVERGQGSWLWEIPGFSGLPKKMGISLFSPYIDQAGREWFMSLLPHGSENFSDGGMRLVVWRWDVGPEKTFHCTVGVRRADGVEETVGRQTVKLDHHYNQRVLYEFRRRAEDCKEGEILSSDTLTITLRIRTKEGEAAASQSMMRLSTHMGELLSQSDDHDVRFRVGDKEFPAHRNILKARCPVFSKMLTHDTQENQSGIIRIEDCDADVFGVFLTYVYSGKAENLTPEIALDLHYYAEKYDFSWLKEQCVSFLEESVSETTVGDAFLLSVKHGESELMKAATNFFIENIKEIVVTVEWQNFVIKNPIQGNELYIQYVSKMYKK